MVRERVDFKPKWRRFLSFGVGAIACLSGGAAFAGAMPQSVYFPALGVKDLALKASPGTRRCCMLGADLAMLGLVPARQTAEPSALGTHFYGYGKGEQNGMVASCRAGFIDIAHMRYSGDLVLKFALEIEALGAQGGELKMKFDAGRGRVLIEPLRDPELGIRMRTPEELLELAGSIALDVVSWHEIITWFNYSAVPFYTEKGSSFSPEDPFSNQVGIVLAKKALLRSTRENIDYSTAMTSEISLFLEEARALPESETIRILRALDLHSPDRIGEAWFDSKYQLPNYRRLIKRNMQLFGSLKPILPPRALLPNECAEDPRSLLEVHQPSVWSDYRLEVRLKKGDSASRQVIDYAEQTITQEDFPALIEWVRTQIESEWPEAVFKSSPTQVRQQAPLGSSE